MLGMIRFACFLLSIHLICLPMHLATSTFASEFDDGIQGVTQDEEESQSLFRRILKSKHKVVPVPIPISNPTIGTGLALGILYLHPQDEGDESLYKTTSGVVGMYTNSKSWMAGGFHSGSYLNDRIRPDAFVGYGDFNLKFYGIGDTPLPPGTYINYEAKTFFFMPKVLLRLASTRWFLGPDFYYLDIDATFDLSDILPDNPSVNAKSKTGGLGLVGLYDSRDDNYWPMKGLRFEAIARNYGEHFGGDFKYNKFLLALGQYFSIRDRVTFTYRLDGQFIEGEAPFYDLSTIALRGYPMGRFIDNHMMSAQGEVRWNCFWRITALAFGGGGVTAGEIDAFGDATPRWAGGAGFRFLILKEQKFNLGCDFAWGEDEFAFYIQIGDWLSR